MPADVSMVAENVPPPVGAAVAVSPLTLAWKVAPPQFTVLKVTVILSLLRRPLLPFSSYRSGSTSAWLMVHF